MDLTAVDVLYDFCIMSGLMFLGKVARSKIPLIQNLYIPSALMAGVMGLFLGQYFLNILPFSSAIGDYAGILVVVLFATLFLGNEDEKSTVQRIKGVGDTFLINGAAEFIQYGIFILVGFFVLKPLFTDIHDGFGMLVTGGFFGGHGTAAALGSFFADNGWADATSIGQTFATFGLVAGIIVGIMMINHGTKKGYTRLMRQASELSEELKTGLIHESNYVTLGRTTVSPISIDPLTWHVSLVMMAVGGAYLANAGLKILMPTVTLPTYGLGLIFSVVIHYLLKAVKMDGYIEKKMIGRIGSCATDYLVAFGVASVNIQIVIQYWKPIAILCVGSVFFVVAYFYLVSKRFFHNYWFERGIYVFGMATGVMSTGVILLRVVDPEFKTGILEDFGIAWLALTMVDLVLVSVVPIMIMQGQGILAGAALILLGVVALAISGKIYGIQHKDGSIRRPNELDYD